MTNAQLYAESRRIADEQAVLRRVATLVARGVEPAEVFGAVADELRRCLRAHTAGLWRFETSGEMTLLAAAAEPALLAKWPVGTLSDYHCASSVGTVMGAFASGPGVPPSEATSRSRARPR